MLKRGGGEHIPQCCFQKWAAGGAPSKRLQTPLFCFDKGRGETTFFLALPSLFWNALVLRLGGTGEQAVEDGSAQTRLLLGWKPPGGGEFWRWESQRLVPVELRRDGCSQEAQPAAHPSRPRVVPAGLREWVAARNKLHDRVRVLKGEIWQITTKLYKKKKSSTYAIPI